jgi:hypothetical protein
MNRLDVLKASLAKKEAKLDERFESRFDLQRQTNGQPMNDKRNGQAFFKKCDKSDDAIRNQMKEVEKTKNAIEREEWKQKHCELVKDRLPAPILELIEQGVLRQWRKFPHICFVEGVEKGRIMWKEGKLLNAYYSSIPTTEQKDKFKNVYNQLKEAI